MLNLRTEISGWFKLVAIKPDGSKRILADWFPNLITNGGLDRYGAYNDWLYYCQVGSGSTPPTVNDTQLESKIAATNTAAAMVGGVMPSSPYYAYRTNTYRFAQGVAAGNISEVGIGWTATGTLYSRALILDGAGQPTTLTILSDETLDVVYQNRHYAPETDVTGQITLRGTVHDWVSRASKVTTGSVNCWEIGNISYLYNAVSAAENGYYWNDIYTGAIGAITLGPGGTRISDCGISTTVYTPGTYYLNYKLTAGLTYGNNALGIGAIFVTIGIGAYQIGFTPNIMKTSSDILELNCRHSWARKTI